MNFLLDTCSFLWLIKGELEGKISSETIAHLGQLENSLFLSTASVWEIMVKHKLGKLPLPENALDFIIKARIDHGISSLPIIESDFQALGKLPDYHRDPFDRMIICQSIENSLPIVTSDSLIKQYPVKSFS